MYTPPPYAENDLATLHAGMREWSFATLVTSGAAGVHATHLPFLLDAQDDGLGVLTTHLSKKNAQYQDLRDGCEALVIFQGPHAYVSPSWYVRQSTFPTWNYCAIHAGGRPQLIEEHEALHAVLRRTVALYDTPVKGAWDFDAMPLTFVAPRLDMIAAMRIPLSTLEGKFKLNQDRSVEDRLGVIAALEGNGDAQAAGVARLMRRRVNAVTQ